MPILPLSAGLSSEDSHGEMHGMYRAVVDEKTPKSFHIQSFKTKSISSTLRQIA